MESQIADYTFLDSAARGVALCARGGSSRKHPPGLGAGSWPFATNARSGAWRVGVCGPRAGAWDRAEAGAGGRAAHADPRALAPENGKAGPTKRLRRPSRGLVSAGPALANLDQPAPSWACSSLDAYINHSTHEEICTVDGDVHLLHHLGLQAATHSISKHAISL